MMHGSTRNLMRKGIRAAIMLPYWGLSDPPRFNIVVNKAEILLGRTKLVSYPRHVGINISNICNQHCIFCSLDNARAEFNNWLDAKLFKKMLWLRHVRFIDLFCGAGEALANPNFPDIATTVRKVAQKSYLSMFTNGLALSGANLKATIENLDAIHVSLNAVDRDVYDSIIRGNYSQVMGNMHNLSAMMPPKFYVELSMVLMRRTVSQVKPMIDYAANHKFKRVIVGHYIATPNIDGIGPDESVKSDPAIVGYVRNLESYAKSRGVEYIFSEAARPPSECFYPWTSIYFTNDETGKRAFGICCSGGRMNCYFSESVYVNFRTFWNSKRMQEIRRTANRPLNQQNNLCFLCRVADKTDADWRTKLVSNQAIRDRGITFTDWCDPDAFPTKYYE